MSALSTFHIVLFCIVSSTCFGLVHSFFSKHDAAAKFFFGLLLSLALILTKNIFIPVIMHLVYNAFALKTARKPEI